MVDKTDEQIAKEKAAVDAMKNAQSNMGKALDRITALETALRNASGTIGRLKRYISPEVYQYRGEKTCHNEAEEAIASIAKVLG